MAKKIPLDQHSLDKGFVLTDSTAEVLAYLARFPCKHAGEFFFAFDPDEFGVGFIRGKEDGAFVGWVGPVCLGQVMGTQEAVGWPVGLVAFG